LALGRRSGSAAGSPGTEGRVFGGYPLAGGADKARLEARTAGLPWGAEQSDRDPTPAAGGPNRTTTRVQADDDCINLELLRGSSRPLSPRSGDLTPGSRSLAVFGRHSGRERRHRGTERTGPSRWGESLARGLPAFGGLRTATCTMAVGLTGHLPPRFCRRAQALADRVPAGAGNVRWRPARRSSKLPPGSPRWLPPRSRGPSPAAILPAMPTKTVLVVG